jgi:hypothetical protein
MELCVVRVWLVLVQAMSQSHLNITDFSLDLYAVYKPKPTITIAFIYGILLHGLNMLQIIYLI